jgi:hypothetical protein
MTMIYLTAAIAKRSVRAEFPTDCDASDLWTSLVIVTAF